MNKEEIQEQIMETLQQLRNHYQKLISSNPIHDRSIIKAVIKVYEKSLKDYEKLLKEKL